MSFSTELNSFHPVADSSRPVRREAYKIIKIILHAEIRIFHNQGSKV